MKTNRQVAEHAMEFLSDRCPINIDQAIYIMMLMQLEDNHGEDALIALAGFYLYAIRYIKGQEGTDAIRSTFSHDLNGAHDKLMQPRSYSYRAFFLAEFYPELLIEDEKQTVEAVKAVKG